MDNKDKDLMLEFRKRLSSDLANHITRLIVFGSRAKGEAAEDSDLDVIAIVDEKNSAIEKSLEDIAYRIMWDHEVKKLIEKAEHALEVAEKLMNDGYPSDAASKIYYSMYYAA